MLNKRFKIAKCKTSLKLATSRIKLMRNKKGVQINAMKKELAQLLESGQDRTARIRVEHVIREEKMVAAYDLIEIYCELIVARLPIIESQKTCPIDLKEAVTSVIFAAPRCSDIPELVDAKKNLTAKYGKEFVSAAIELRPDCGVSRMLVEKLSAVAPDVKTKVKVLSDVAKEYNINWDPTLFEEKESKPPEDLLNGPTYSQKANLISMDSPKVQTSNVQNVYGREGNPNADFDFAQRNKIFTVTAHNVTDEDTVGVHNSFGSTTHDGMMPSGLGFRMMNTGQSFHVNNSNSSSGGENWNMEFKDATSAAQAAAESAERASMAARAAAQLSSQGKINRQHSTEYTGQRQFKDSDKDTSFNGRKPKMQNHQMGPTEIDTSLKATKKSSSLRPRNDSVSKRVGLTFDQQKAGQRNDVDQENHFRNYGDAHREDETDSDDGPRFDTAFEYDEGEAKSFFPSPDRESFYLPENTHILSLSPKKGMSDTMGRVDSEKAVDHSVKFDLSDGPGSESESEMTKSSFTKMSTSRVDHVKSRIQLNDLVERGSSFGKETYDLDAGKDLKSGSLTGGVQDKGSFDYPSYPKTKEHPIDPTSKPGSFNLRVSRSGYKTQSGSLSGSESDSDHFDAGKDLKFGSLTGGIQNKSGFDYPPYTKTKENPVGPTSKLSSFNSRASRSGYKTQSGPLSGSEPDSDEYSETFVLQKSSKLRSQFARPDEFFNEGDTDSEEVSPVSKRTSTGKVHLAPGSSRRTKGPVEPVGKTVTSNPSPFEKLKKKPGPESEAEQNSSPRSNTNRSPPSEPARFKQEPSRIKPVAKIVTSGPPAYENLKKKPVTNHEVEQKSSLSSNITNSLPKPQPEPARFRQEPSRTKPDPKIPEPGPNPIKKTVESRKTEAPETLNLSSETKVEANNVKKPSHVHPKLPEYDSLAARIQALSKMNHR